MYFTVISRASDVPSQGVNQAFLRIDHWNDYSFVTMFDVTLFDEHGIAHELGAVKIGFAGQTTSQSTYSTLPSQFSSLSEAYFSLGTDVEYYRVLSEKVSDVCRTAYLSQLNDIARDDQAMARAEKEEVLRVSLLRYTGISAVNAQFKRVLHGHAPLSSFDFVYQRPQTDKYAAVNIDFKVHANSRPSTNIHAVIGRNGVGKTTLLNDMIISIMGGRGALGGFRQADPFGMHDPIGRDFFSNLVSVSFSAFDPFEPPQDRENTDLGTRYSYIGLKDQKRPETLKTIPALRLECLKSLGECFADPRKRQRWLAAILTLGSDENFAQMALWELTSMPDGQWQLQANWFVERMSAGHAIVLLTITKLVARVDEKTLVLLDEPESHLHPPLLSAFTRALSELLHSRNGVAIIATHSPVVLQEVPSSCVTIITRSRLSLSSIRPPIETFGENVGVLTREVFGLEVSKSGFHTVLQAEVDRGESYEDVVANYSGQLGMEAKGILRAMELNAKDGERQQ
ncbi:AAA family ATPase [Agrobacterium sp. T29]|uniref:AAA family ATPase n=1 Tax=Agrobacterium sp. T29 TaxID=2580515 RepID=UPI001AEF1C5E|nr:AAA family ATPase [Agrobacterium sp. T29]